MNRFEQRLKKRLQHPEFVAGFREMDAEIELIAALDQIREALHISKGELAERMGRPRASLSRLFNGENANPTLETITEILTALGVTAEIKLRKADNADHPIHIETAL